MKLIRRIMKKAKAEQTFLRVNKAIRRYYKNDWGGPARFTSYHNEKGDIICQITYSIDLFLLPQSNQSAKGVLSFEK